jgi:ankyrin repeat protein
VNSLIIGGEINDQKSDGHEGYTALLTAVFYNSKECVEFLLEKGEVSHLLQLFISNRFYLTDIFFVTN